MKEGTLEFRSSIIAKIDFHTIFYNLRELKAELTGIQLPDGLKYWSKDISQRFEEEGFEVIVSGSAAYGACDLDLKLLNFVDVLVHFAHTPIAEIERVIYAPYYYDYDVTLLEEMIDRIEEKNVALAGTAQYAWKFQELREYLRQRGFNVELGVAKGRIKLDGQVLGCNYSVLKDISANAVLFIGDGFFHPKGAAIYTGLKVYRYSPLTGEFGVIDEAEVRDFIKKRHLRISKAMENIQKGVGIIVSTKTGQNRLLAAKKLKKIAENSNLKADIILLDDIFPEKLLNFPYGVYVNTACPRITYDDSERYHVPILTLQEFEILAKKRKWDDFEMDEIY